MNEDNLHLHLPALVQPRIDILNLHHKEITDYRIAAGLLFHRWREKDLRYVTVDTKNADFTIHIPNSIRISVSSKAIETLKKQRCLETHLSHRDRLILTIHGARNVVNKWFSDSASVLDRMAVSQMLGKR